MDVLGAFCGGKATTTVTNTLYTYASLLYASFCTFVPEMYTTTGLFTLLSTVFIVGVAGAHWWRSPAAKSSQTKSNKRDETMSSSALDTSVLPCIRNRRSIFPSEYDKSPAADVDPAIIRSLLDAALWSPWHGKCAGNPHPAKFIVLGRKGMVQMQELTLDYYDRNWKKVGWGSGRRGTEEQYLAWRKMTHGEITGRWGPCSYMIAIVMQRQSGEKRLPEWEEAAATATAVQNLHLQSTKFPSLACYWSSWHDAARDSDEMKRFLNMKPEDKCLGFFVVAQVKAGQKDRRRRDPSLLRVEWRD